MGNEVKILYVLLFFSTVIIIVVFMMNTIHDGSNRMLFQYETCLIVYAQLNMIRFASLVPTVQVFADDSLCKTGNKGYQYFD